MIDPGRQTPRALHAAQAGKLGAEGVCVRESCYSPEVRDSGFCEDCLDYLRGDVA